MKTADMAHAETIKRFGRAVGDGGDGGDGGVGALGFSEGKQVPSISPLWLENIPWFTMKNREETWRMKSSNIEDLTRFNYPKNRGFHMLHKHTEMGIILNFFMVPQDQEPSATGFCLGSM